MIVKNCLCFYEKEIITLKVVTYLCTFPIVSQHNVSNRVRGAISLDPCYLH